MNTSIQNFDLAEFYSANTSNQLLNPEILGHGIILNLTPGTEKQINIIKSFESLSPGWDSYNAEIPSATSISKAINFLLFQVPFKLDPFFVAPTSDGDILLEFKHGNSTLELLFGLEQDEISAWENETLVVEASLNQTTVLSYFRWLICPNGDCPDC